ncbi:hypothetical protein QN277_000582 [Acacia crassicarpa]|uniref:Uncharacterized protein n=1 Tax=Acacia crassicarpa TaxID=499986 RepID=A0AAE1THA6_9FABA|nr:hypothetical protein QN277_000582 [Acacia crassicarpa]
MIKHTCESNIEYASQQLLSGTLRKCGPFSASPVIQFNTQERRERRDAPWRRIAKQSQSCGYSLAFHLKRLLSSVPNVRIRITGENWLILIREFLQQALKMVPEAIQERIPTDAHTVITDSASGFSVNKTEDKGKQLA